MCGEYGGRTNRPHYHAILFNHNPSDWAYLFDSPSGSPVYTSLDIENTWQNGFVTVGQVTFESAAYVARYCLKKLNGPLAEQVNEKTGLRPYERVDSFTGDIKQVMPEYSRMSRGGRSGHGVAHSWIDKYRSDCFPKDFTTVRGVRVKPPRYYDKFLEQVDPAMYDDIKQGRIIKALDNLADNTVERLFAKHEYQESLNKLLIRSL